MAATKYSHPFMQGLKSPPEGYEEEMQQIRECDFPENTVTEWSFPTETALKFTALPRCFVKNNLDTFIFTNRGSNKYLMLIRMKSQPHLPYISDEYVTLFLHSNYYKVKETKDTIECYFTLRTNTPDLFSNRDPLAPRNKQILDIAHMIGLPNKTSEGYHVLLYRLSDFDYSKLNFADAVRVFCMFNDVKLSEDRLSDGYIVIFDMKGCSLGHLTRVTLPALRAFMLYIQSAHPCRLKKIHVVHTVSFINQVMCLVKPLIHSNLLNLLNFSSEGPASVVDKELLPEDYGGPLPPVKHLHAEQRKNMEENYRDWLIETEIFKVDEKKRIKKPSRGMFASFTSSFKSLDID